MPGPGACPSCREQFRFSKKHARTGDGRAARQEAESGREEMGRETRARSAQGGDPRFGS